MNVDMSLFGLFANASVVVQFVMIILLLASLVSWTFIIQKWRDFRATRVDAEQFEKRFWSGIDLVELYRQITKRGQANSGMAQVFEAGFREFARLRSQDGLAPEVVVEGAQRSMRAALNRELDRMEGRLGFLATVGSTSPYIGLFGTVWGIMNSFRALGATEYATLSMVAPGIAEALIATAMGLFAAIPAVIAYNRYTNQVERLVSRFETFSEEFSVLLQRQAHTAAASRQ